MSREKSGNKTKPRWMRVIFRRRVFVIFLILLQMMLIAGMFFSAGTKYVFFSPLMSFLSYCVVIYIFGAEDKPAYKLTWIVVILTLPFFGGIFYIIFKNRVISGKLKNKVDEIEKKTEELLKCDKNVAEGLKRYDLNCYQNSKYLFSYKGFPVYKNTSVKYLKSGKEKFDELICELKKAEKFIFLEYFIISSGEIWNSILKILREKARAGVEVRVMYDDIGCFTMLPKNYHKILERYGIKCVIFGPFTPVLSTIQNNRDHRKIAVIDGKTAFTGGINIGDEYANIIEKYGHWKDCAVKIEGEAVWSLTVMFLQMWNVFKETDKDFAVYKADFASQTDGFVQPYCDGPLDDDAVGEHVYMSIINRACDYIYITTPYLILEDAMLAALCDAAKTGIDVRIITPHIPDKAYVHLTTRSYYAELIKAGVKIYEYEKGFIHSKIFLSDDKTATVGTVNADYRSLYLHFECGVLFHGSRVTADIKNDFLKTIDESIKITEKDCKKNIFITIIQRLLRLFAPLM